MMNTQHSGSMSNNTNNICTQIETFMSYTESKLIISPPQNELNSICRKFFKPYLIINMKVSIPSSLVVP